jgi:hypothetical protein
MNSRTADAKSNEHPDVSPRPDEDEHTAGAKVVLTPALKNPLTTARE